MTTPGSGPLLPSAMTPRPSDGGTGPSRHSKSQTSSPGRGECPSGFAERLDFRIQEMARTVTSSAPDSKARTRCSLRRQKPQDPQPYLGASPLATNGWAHPEKLDILGGRGCSRDEETLLGNGGREEGVSGNPACHDKRETRWARDPRPPTRLRSWWLRGLADTGAGGWGGCPCGS